MKGFLPTSTLAAAKAPVSLVPKCGACGLYKGCRTPKMVPYGNGRRRVLVVGEFPGAAEDEAGRPFMGQAGQMLRKYLEMIGVDLDEDCWATNATICHATHAKGNYIPDKEIAYCAPNLSRTLATLAPDVIIPLGTCAVESLISQVWKDHDIGGITKWAGWNIPCTTPNAWICPTFHPSLLLRAQSKVLDRTFLRHLEKAFELQGKPWDVIPDYKSQVQLVYDHEEAARILREMNRRGGVVAVDYETTCLKPEYPGGEIVCCSVCWEGKKTIAYPWHGEAIVATGELLKSDRTTKIASNLKFEDRWTRFTFGHPVTNWLHDTMVCAHVLDNRRGITGLKFQAFALLGAEAYDDHLKDLLRSEADSHLNQVKQEIDLGQLLTYCGIDTLLEYLLAMKQRAQLT